MNWGIVIMSISLSVLGALLIFLGYFFWEDLKKEKKLNRYEKILLNLIVVFFVILLILPPIISAQRLYHERFRTAVGSVSWNRYALPNDGDCDAGCKAQCGKDDYTHVVGSNTTSCDCVCVRQCILCKDIPDSDVKAWIEGMD